MADDLAVQCTTPNMRMNAACDTATDTTDTKVYLIAFLPVGVAARSLRDEMVRRIGGSLRGAQRRQRVGDSVFLGALTAACCGRRAQNGMGAGRGQGKELARATSPSH